MEDVPIPNSEADEADGGSQARRESVLLGGTAFGFRLEADRNLFHLPLPSLTAFPKYLPLFSSTFTLLLACNARGITDEDLADFAESVLKQGAIYVCAWGPGSERVQSGFAATKSDVMTTWHDGTLEEALESFLKAAPLDDQAAAYCKAAIAVSAGDEDWAKRIESVMQAQIPAGARTYVYSGMSSSGCWMRDDFDEPLEEFAEYT